MNCIGFPKIFSGNSTIIKKDESATLECLKLLVASEKNSMIGDPYFGIRLKKYFFEQNNYVLRDILIDELYEQIMTFMPQLTLTRNNIKITQQDNKLYAHINVTQKKDFTPSTYDLVLFNEEEE